MSTYDDFKDRFKLLASKNQNLVVNTLSNIFTMRLIGNKTHGDLAEKGHKLANDILQKDIERLKKS
ncbi:MAG: hypothetical protein WCX79_03120 [Candidatus Paceibacterota bacterium]|jgi:hypothetical protein